MQARVLICDDSAAGREIIVRPFHEACVIVDEVDDGDRAIAACRRTVYSLVLIEKWVWPSGLEIAREIRALASPFSDPSIVIVASCSIEEISLTDMFLHGVDDVVTKLWSDDKLVRLARSGHAENTLFPRC